MDDYITGAEQVGADPTAAVETVASVDTEKKVDPVTDVYEFKEYDLKEYDNKAFAEKTHDYGDYYDFGLTGAKPTPTTYEEEFGPGVPAETDFRESSVSGAGVGWMWWGQGGFWRLMVRNVERILVAWCLMGYFHSALFVYCS